MRVSQEPACGGLYRLCAAGGGAAAFGGLLPARQTASKTGANSRGSKYRFAQVPLGPHATNKVVKMAICPQPCAERLRTGSQSFASVRSKASYTGGGATAMRTWPGRPKLAQSRSLKPWARRAASSAGSSCAASGGRAVKKLVWLGSACQPACASPSSYCARHWHKVARLRDRKSVV